MGKHTLRKRHEITQMLSGSVATNIICEPLCIRQLYQPGKKTEQTSTFPANSFRLFGYREFQNVEVFSIFQTVESCKEARKLSNILY